MIIEPYLFYEGRCDEAIEFYRTALDAEVTAMYRFKDSPEPEECPPGQEEKVMHANLQIGNTTVMVSDGYCQGQANFQGFALSITADDEAQARRYFGALLEGGEEKMPLGKTFWSPCFGMVVDRFGVLWMVGVM